MKNRERLAWVLVLALAILIGIGFGYSAHRQRQALMREQAAAEAAVESARKSLEIAHAKQAPR